MKTIITDNHELLEILAQQGFSLICNPEMQVTITDEEAERLPSVIAEIALAAAYDYTIVD